MKPTYHYTTVLEVTSDLQKKSFTYDFNIHQEAVKLIHMFTKSFMYAFMMGYRPRWKISCLWNNFQFRKKGFIVSGFLANSDNKTATILANLGIEGTGGDCKIWLSNNKVKIKK